MLRQVPIAGQTSYPRPVRSIGKMDEYGLHDLTQDERSKVQDDDIVMWKMITLFIVATFVRGAIWTL